MKSIPSLSPSPISPPKSSPEDGSLKDLKSSTVAKRPSDIQLEFPKKSTHLRAALSEHGGHSFLHYTKSWSFPISIFSLQLHSTTLLSLEKMILNFSKTRFETLEKNNTLSIPLLQIGLAGCSELYLDPLGPTDNLCFTTVSNDPSVGIGWSRVLKTATNHPSSDLFVTFTSAGGELLSGGPEKVGNICLQTTNTMTWEKEIDHDLMAVQVCDLTGDGNEEIVAASWDGMVFVFNQKGDALRYKFDESIAAFQVGYYSKNLSQPPTLCFVGVTYNDEITIFENVHFDQIQRVKLSDLMIKQMEEFELLKENRGL